MRPLPGAFELNKKGASRYDWRDPYHVMVTLTWPWFFAALVLADLLINLVFALLYMIEPGSVAKARPGDFGDHFFFSLETLATVGYGEMAPATLYGHIISATEILCGMALIAIMTGLTFVRFSRPQAKFLFADTAVITPFNGRRTLMIRIGNGRVTTMTDAVARLGVLLSERTQEGQFYRRIHDLKLLRHRLPLFGLTWTLMHEIDEDSPLHGCDAAWIATAEARLFMSVEARDQALMARVSDIRDYGPEAIRFGVRYADAVTSQGGRTFADLTLISATEPDSASQERSA
jgi:inward rectifier potassium channel